MYEITMVGEFNVRNAAMAVSAGLFAGLTPLQIREGLLSFEGVARRQELKGEVNGVKVVDDFAHHPTAIATTLEGLRQSGSGGRLFTVIEPRSNTMRLGAHRERLPDCVGAADRVLWFQPSGMDWDMEAVAAASSHHTSWLPSQELLLTSMYSSPAASARMSSRTRLVRLKLLYCKTR
jgi:UDP-N-acetylmuramate: L-alanyl-gamma-D-glutamyl-meso-diaminopimelate ligase